MADVKISELPSATGPIEPDDILLLVRDGVTYQIDGDDFQTAGVSSFNTRVDDVVLIDTDITAALQYTPVARNANTSIVYGNNSSGQSANIGYSQSETALSLAQRTTLGQLLAATLVDSSPSAEDEDLINRAYAQELRIDRVSTVDSGVVSTTIGSTSDGIIVSGSDVAALTINLPSGVTRFKRVLIKFTTDITALTIGTGLDINTLPNNIDYSPTTAQAGDLFEWGYDVITSTWLITNHISFSSLP